MQSRIMFVAAFALAAISAPVLATFAKAVKQSGAPLND